MPAFDLFLDVEVRVDVLSEKYLQLLVVHEIHSDCLFRKYFICLFLHFGATATNHSLIVSLGRVDKHLIEN